MTTATLSPNTAPAARWIHELALPCAKYPQGMQGILSITSFTRRGPVTAAYTVDPIRDGGRIVGWHLENLDNGQTYDIDHVSWGWSGAECTCGSCVFGHRACKHVLATRAALETTGGIL